MQIKSYTDLEQSRKLAKILPLESADMFFSGCAYPKEVHFPTFSKTSVKDNIPCWSLAALLDVLPVGTESHKQSDGSISYYYVEVYNNKKYFFTKRYDNPVDACYEMIIHLNELNLL